jgi:hypothetical protein
MGGERELEGCLCWLCCACQPYRSRRLPGRKEGGQRGHTCGYAVRARLRGRATAQGPRPPADSALTYA